MAHLSAPRTRGPGPRRRARPRPWATCSPPTPPASRRWARCRAAGHPALYDRGWHPTTVCGPVGAAVAAPRCSAPTASPPPRALRCCGRRPALGVRLGRQVACRSGWPQRPGSMPRGWRRPARGRPRAGARAPAASRRPWAAPSPTRRPPAIDENWIKAYPCCLQTHGAIEARWRARRRAGRRADGARPSGLAPGRRYDASQTALQAKFSIPYLTAFALLRGGPRVESFAGVDPEARALARAHRGAHRPRAGRVGVRAARRREELARVDAARGSPQHPLSPDELAAKVARPCRRPPRRLADDEPAAELITRL